MDVFVLPMEMRVDGRGEYQFTLQPLTSGRGSWPTHWCFTESGWLDAESWLAILRVFKGLMTKIAPGIHPVLLQDNLSVHKTDAVLSFLVANHINACYFPAKCTHFLQPEDDVMFTMFKRMCYKYLASLLALQPTNKEDLGQLLLTGAQAARSAIHPCGGEGLLRAHGRVPVERRAHHRSR